MAKKKKASHTEIIKDIKSGKFAPIYTLCGTEPYFIDMIESHILSSALTEDEKAFNLNILYGKDSTILQVIDAAKRYPMMAERQVVIVREAQVMKDFPELEQYALNPVASTILVLLYKHKKPDGRSVLGKALKKAPNVFFESAQLYDNQVAGWIKKYIAEKGASVNDKEAYLLGEYLGSDLSKIVNEIDKLLLNIDHGETITAEDIEENIGISKDYNIFELQDALTQKDEERLFRIVSYYSSDIKNHHPVMIISVLNSFFGKLFTLKGMKGKPISEIKKATGMYSDYILGINKNNASKYSLAELSLIIETLYEFDLKAKGLGSKSTPPEDLLQELVFRLIRVSPVNYDAIFTE